MLPLAAPPDRVCLLRLSAIGDTCHAVPLLRTLQRAWPGTRFTWIIGRAEARLMSLIEGVEFITVGKQSGLAALRPLGDGLAGREFDLLIHLQLSFRASLASRQVRAPVRLGFDRARARELQWLFTNARVAPRTREHVLDSFLGFADALGVRERLVRWDIPLPADALAYAQQLIPDEQPTLVISPCSSHALRNWTVAGYAALAEVAATRHRMRVILCGGPSLLEREVAAAVEARCGAPLVNQVGRDTLPQMLALLARATVLVSPDSGPAHMATMVDTPVVGLYAATNPDRSGPYLSRRWCVNKYVEAARRFRHREPEQLPWTAKIEEPGVMELIGIDDVVERLDAVLAKGAGESPASR